MPIFTVNNFSNLQEFMTNEMISICYAITCNFNLVTFELITVIERHINLFRL